MKTKTNPQSICFASFLIILASLPLPLGMQRPVAWDILQVAVYSLTFVTILVFKYEEIVSRIKAFLWLILPLFAFEIWTLIQCTHLPLFLVDILRPKFLLEINSSLNTISLSPSLTRTQLEKGLCYVIFIVNGIILINTKKKAIMVCICLVAAGTFEAFYGAIEVLLNIRHSWFLGIVQGVKANGTFVYHNHLANYLLLTSSIGFGLMISQLHHSKSISWAERISRWLSALSSRKLVIRLCLIIMVIGLVLTKSRMGNFTFFSITTLGCIIVFLFYKNRPRVLVPLLISILAIDVLIIGMLFGIENVAQHIENTQLLKESRDEAFYWSINIVKDFPFIGIGLGVFDTIFPYYTEYNIGYYNYVHNDYIQFTLESGLIGCVFLIIPIVYSLYLNFLVIIKRKDKVIKGMSLGSLLGTLAMLMHIAVDFNLQIPANAMTFLLMLSIPGVLINLPSTNSNQR